MRSFVDKNHENSDEFYQLIESKHDIADVMRIIDKDRDFLDPYLYLTEMLIDQGHDSEANLFAEKAFVHALAMILDIDGTWPDELLWGFHENRHIIRVLARKADYEWQQGHTENALALYKNLLRTNPGDNIAARYSIVAIRNGFTYKKYIQEVWPSDNVPASKIEKWFKKYSPLCAEDLAEWKQYCIDKLGLTEDEIS